jgi:hypothetical protein
MIPRTALYNMDKEQYLKEANQMFQEQIINAHIHGHNAPSSTLKNFDAKQYYDQTFKSE